MIYLLVLRLHSLRPVICRTTGSVVVLALLTNQQGLNVFSAT